VKILKCFATVLTLATLLSSTPIVGPSIAFAADLSPSGYSLYSGDKFFVLTDGVFTSTENIEVRFETAGNRELDKFSGVDVRLYRIPKPLDFLKSQKNLHRPSVKGRHTGEGLENVLSYLWDSWFKKSRLAMQRVFSSDARKQAVKSVPNLEQVPAHTYQTELRQTTQFAPLKGFQLVDSFRYPIWIAKPFKPNQSTLLEGSSSEFIRTKAGNVILPMGKRRPGLYLVEAMIGTYRATTLAFVSDTLTVTKVSSQQALVWSVNRLSGLSRAGSQVLLTDGVGVLGQGKTDSSGVMLLKRAIPERSFAMVEDADGGVSVSENFFYDSEAFQPKVYVFTDRPLYQPGDHVQLRAFGRDLKRIGQRDSWSPLPAATASLRVLDSTGIELLSQRVKWDAVTGADANFQLPDSAETGGYTVHLKVDDETYGAAFRVARFTKPHFDSQIQFDKPAYRVGEAVRGRLVLTYPDGKPVVGAEISLELRAETMSMFEGAYAYSGAQEVSLSEADYESDAKGEVAFSFPPATKPSRYIASARARDGAAFRVSTTKDILIEGYLETYLLTSDVNASEQGAPVRITYERQGMDAGNFVQGLTQWQAIRLEDRSVTTGTVKSTDRGEFVLNLAKSGHYIVRVVDASGVTRGTRSHVVLGPDLKSVTGQLEILADKEAYKIGETASLLLTFPFKADDALLTLERNEVSSHGRLAAAGGWFTAKRLSDSQWRVQVLVSELHAPNIIFSVAYAKNRDFGFQNKGIQVKKPMIDITFRPEKAEYSPGEKVIVQVETKLEGKPISALAAVGVVDEMIYVLQPEVVPSIGEFFHHRRRNQVRTTSSMSFYSFNPATSAVSGDTPRSAGRDLKVSQERARRDARDTAYWNGNLKTGADGRAKFEFVMPDALTRWRITGRAIATSGDLGIVGEAKGFVLSNKNYYLKWTGPTRFRNGDTPRPALIAFNSTRQALDAEISINGSGSAVKSEAYSFSQTIKMNPGANSIVLSKIPQQSQTLQVRILVSGKVADALETRVDFLPTNWLKSQSKSIRLEKRETLSLPTNARNVRLKLVPESGHQFLRIVDDLLEYPWGCVEQTSSRLIPLSIAVEALRAHSDQDARPQYLQQLMDRIAFERRRLVSMAGPNAAFTWWGDATGEDLFVTAHAYHADWRAAKLLGIELPKANWEHLLKIYSENKTASAFERTYALWVLSLIGLPVSEQAVALSKEILAMPMRAHPKESLASSSIYMDSSDLHRTLAILLIGAVSTKNTQLDPTFKRQFESLLSSQSTSTSPAYRAAALYARTQAKGTPANLAEAEDILSQIRLETPTIDKALALSMIEQALNRNIGVKPAVADAEIGKGWVRVPKAAVPTFRWSNTQAFTNSVSLPAVKGAIAEVAYEQPEDFNSTLDVDVSRSLYHLELDDSDEGSMSATPVAPGEKLDSRSLYIDEVTVSSSKKGGRFGLIEVPLPPGGEVDGTTWGLSFGDFHANFQTARPSSSGLGYAVALPSLSQAVRVHQLVRFPSAGKFKLPPVKVFKMYRPSERAYEKEQKFAEVIVE
jgi:uncharacterized protein YfaS (alpha-2-macroglobulin family)